jgi:hypothetical protein
MTDNVERIAVLEAEVEKLQESQKEILDCIHAVRDEMMRYKGFLGGVAFLASGIGIFLTVFKDWILKHFA